MEECAGIQPPRLYGLVPLRMREDRKEGKRNGKQEEAICHMSSSQFAKVKRSNGWRQTRIINTAHNRSIHRV